MLPPGRWFGPTKYPEVLMSLSAMPSAFARAISLPALAARSCCAAVAVLSFDSTPTEISARSGFLDTSPSPLVITPGSNVEPVDEADGAASNIEGRLTASTARVATSAHRVPTAAENATVRKVDCMFADPPVVQTPRSQAA